LCSTTGSSRSGFTSSPGCRLQSSRESGAGSRFFLHITLGCHRCGPSIFTTHLAVHGVHGKGHKQTIYGKNRQEVAAKLAKALSDREGGLTFDAEELKLGEYLVCWLTDSVKVSVRHLTYRGYDRLVRNHITRTLGSI
jgi:hypothetical protein